MKRLTGTLFAIACLFAGGAALACEKPAGAAQIEADVAAWINAERAQKGLRKLDASAQLKSAAQSHACDMARRSYFEHEGPGGPTFVRRINKSGYDYTTAVENLAKGVTGTAEEAGMLWKRSPHHWKNVLNPRLDDLGIAVAQDGPYLLVVFVGGAS